MISSSFQLVIEQNLVRAALCHESNHVHKSRFLLTSRCLFPVYIDQWTFVCREETKRFPGCPLTFPKGKIHSSQRPVYDWVSEGGSYKSTLATLGV